MHSFYLSPALWNDAPCLEGQEAHHAINVLRLTAGEQVKILDGQGRTGIFRITSIKQKKLFLAPVSSAFSPCPESRAIMALAFSKAVRRDFFVEKAAELGAHAVWIWQADHSQGKLSGTLAANLSRQMIAGIKQCGNPWLPDVKVLPAGIEALIAQSGQADYRILPWELQSADCMLTTDLAGRKGTTLYVIGPEGGFSERELAIFDAHAFSRVSLGNRVLRCETAATLCLGIHWWASQLSGHDKTTGSI